MNTEKMLAKTVNEIVDAFRVGGVPAAVAVYEPHSAFYNAIRAELSGKIPSLFIERICFKPKRT